MIRQSPLFDQGPHLLNVHVAGLAAGVGHSNRSLQNLRHGQAKLAHRESGDKKPEENLINNTFYHLPREQTMANWHDRVPTGFSFAVKASRYITHIKKLRNTTEEVKRFFDLAGRLGDRLGPILYQLPPSLHKDLTRLGDFIAGVPMRDRAVFEFRHASWYAQDTFDLLNEHGVALCIHDMGGAVAPRVVTGGMVYIRFHGVEGRCQGNYPDDTLREWADWIRSQSKAARSVYAYFNNDVSGHAIHNAQTLKQFIGLTA